MTTILVLTLSNLFMTFAWRSRSGPWFERNCPLMKRRLSIATFSPYPFPCEPPWRWQTPALQAALKYNDSVYDALYCALAIEHRCDFVTADRALANKLQGVFPFIVHLSAIKP
jgi:hypothetical protein